VGAIPVRVHANVDHLHPSDYVELDEADAARLIAMGLASPCEPAADQADDSAGEVVESTEETLQRVGAGEQLPAVPGSTPLPPVATADDPPSGTGS